MKDALHWENISKKQVLVLHNICKLISDEEAGQLVLKIMKNYGLPSALHSSQCVPIKSCHIFPQSRHCPWFYNSMLVMKYWILNSRTTSAAAKVSAFSFSIRYEFERAAIRLSHLKWIPDCWEEFLKVFPHSQHWRGIMRRPTPMHREIKRKRKGRKRKERKTETHWVTHPLTSLYWPASNPESFETLKNAINT